ncbi:MAG TPA: hypothetical protein VGW35_06945 [Methylomirabilota bacterium]|jgi:heterotetrameric sarcosine oxidase gamma subunit|nr:hypothetical protein [Methylomirabilota bacterium]HEV8673507.1 hypothetical protein [Methylomirabilota bacterium]
MSPATFRPIRISAMYGAHVALGARFKDDGDWRVPDAYTSARQEAAEALAAVGLADTSACGKLTVRGEALGPVLAKAAGVDRLAVGTATRVRINGAGVLVGRLADDELLVLTPLADAAAVGEVLAKSAGAGCAHVTDLTSGLAVMDLIGPRVGGLLAKVAPVDLSEGAVPALAVVQGELARVPAILIRLDRTPALAFRALVARECGAFVWEALVDAGRDLGLTPIGAAACALLNGSE